MPSQRPTVGLRSRFNSRPASIATRLALRLVRAGAALLVACSLSAAAQTSEPPISRPALTLSAEERSWLAQHPRLPVFTKTEWAPIDLYTYEGQFRGLSGDYLALIGQRLGVAFDFKAAPTLAASLEALKRGEALILPSVLRTPQREAFTDFSHPLC